MNRVFRAFRLSVSAIALVAGMVSCAKDTEVVDPYANWEGKNKAFIDSIADVANNPESGEIWRKYLDYRIEFDGGLNNSQNPYIPKVEDYVYVKYKSQEDVYEDYKENPLIMFCDTVNAAYQGFLINGTRFDGNYYGTFDKNVNDNFTKFGVNEVITGWTTALLYMKPKNSNIVEVFIPSELGEGIQGTSSIPTKSAFRFEIYVDEVIKPKLQK